MTDRCAYAGCLGPADGSECRHPEPEPTITHPDPRDEPNIGRTHAADRYPDCGLCRCGAHNVPDDPDACPDCRARIAASTTR